MFKDILDGAAPSSVFRHLLNENPQLDNWELASRFKEEFERVDSLAQQLIWHWQRPGGRPGMQDEEVDRRLTELLEAAGYRVGRSEDH